MSNVEVSRRFRGETSDNLAIYSTQQLLECAMLLVACLDRSVAAHTWAKKGAGMMVRGATLATFFSGSFATAAVKEGRLLK